MNRNGQETIGRLARRLRRRHYQQAQLEPQAPLGDVEQPLETCCGGHHEHHHPKTAEFEKHIEQLRDQLVRAQAEFDNYRKRQRREEQQRIELAGQRLIEQLLPVVDNFKRALQTPGDSLASLLSGLEMVNKQMQDILQQNGLEAINPVGQPFDPNQHEAVSVEAATDKPENEVVAVFQEGYSLKGRLLRPAMVKVARG